MALPTRGQPDWDDELNNEIQRLDGDVQSAKADASSAKSTAISAQNSADAAANSAAQSATSAQVAADSANKPTADAMGAVLADPESAASRRLSVTYGRGVSILDPQFAVAGQAGVGNADADTAALQAACDANAGAVFLPGLPDGAPYLINQTITLVGTAGRKIVGLGSGTSVRVEFSGTGYCFQSIAATPGNPSSHASNLGFHDLNIVPAAGSETVPSGGINLVGCHQVVIDNVDVRDFTKAGAVGIRLADCFNVTAKHFMSRGITNGIGVEITGSDMQPTNLQFWDFLVQSNATGFSLSSGIQGGGLSVKDGAILTTAGGVGFDWTGEYVNAHFSGLHVECYEPVGSNTSTGIRLSGAALSASNVAFDGLDFSNVKTLFDIDGSSGVARNLTFDHIYATGQTGLAGTGLKLNAAKNVRLGHHQINTTFYPTPYSFTASEVARTISAMPSTSLPAASADNQGQIVSLTDKTWADRDILRVSVGAWWARFVHADVSGVVTLPGELQWASNQRIIQGTGDPEGAASAVSGSLYLRTNGIIYQKESGSGNTGWRMLNQIARTSAQMGTVTDLVNQTSVKRVGQMVFNSTVGKPLWASGASPTSPWVDATGATVVTPA